MDRRSWPWKKKTSEKIVAATDSTGASLASSIGNQVDQNNSKNETFVQISVETYAHLNDLEEQVKILNEKLALSDEKLASAQTEITTKESLVKQHTKVAEEAVSGWEKAEAEALALKHQLESVTLQRLSAEERASQLDGALKECMKQIRNVKEENEQKLHDVVFMKTKQWEKVKFELEAKIGDLEQEILRASADNTALSRTLQERSNMLMKISEEKSLADAEIEVLKSNIQSCEKTINSLQYELHIISKELEIRNEEKNMSMRSAEVANKQNLESVKKITKLEAECQRLRGLVRKKLPGPAALAQMKLEVENLGRDYGEPRLRRSPAKSSSPHLSPPTDISLDNSQHCHKETEFLTARLLAMEEETKMLKEALSKRNTELQASRNMCAKTASKLRSMEAQMFMSNQQKSPQKSNAEIPIEGSLNQVSSNPPSLTSMSEDGIEDEGSCAESWATALISELSHFKKEKYADKGNKADNSNHLELMDDFLEMEKLACLSTESNGSISISNNVTDKKTINADSNALIDHATGGDLQTEKQPDSGPPANMIASNEESSVVEFATDQSQVTLPKLQSRIALIFESQTNDPDIGKILQDIKSVVQDASCEQKPCPQDSGEKSESGGPLVDNCKPCIDSDKTISDDLEKAICQIHEFVVSLGKEVMEMQDRCSGGHALSLKIEEFSEYVSKVLCGKMSMVDFIFDLSHVLADASDLSFNVPSDKGNEGESNSTDYIDKATLLEKKVDSSKERFSGECTILSHSTSDSEILHQRAGSGSELKPTLCQCSLEEFEQLKLEKDGMAVDLARCTENLEHKTFQLMEMEQLLAELKSQLASSQKSNSLSETQLKCMAESYNLLESRVQELETELSLLRTKAETLDNELQEEKRSHQVALVKCKDLQEQIQRNERCSTCSISSTADVDIKTKQEREITAAAEKLAECQETIFLLGRQLKALRSSPTEVTGSPNNDQTLEELSEDELSPSGLNPKDLDQAEVDSMSSNTRTMGSGSPLRTYSSAPMSPSDPEQSPILRSPSNSKRPKQKPSKSNSTSLVLTPEKHGHSFSRFFSRGKNAY